MDSLKKQFKSLKSNEFKEVYTKGKKIVTSFYVLFILKGKEELKVGVVASKKIGKAVKRNRAKRRLREIVRLSQPFLSKNMWLVLVARKGILKADFWQAQKLFLNKIKNETDSV
ncbi:ribonuclease P protein component [Hippea alviniae]|uniref:ribonuclease P protein component n=1 Tax=Hippea alviniae TaxID=1279027 RepID=UPI002351D7AD|nr:ribonuclease P protein component [Hippea alviniae]